MTGKGILSAGAAAMAGFAVTLAALWPGNLTAVVQKVDSKLKPTMMVDGIQVRLSPAQAEAYKAGDQPVLHLEAVSTDGRPGKFTIMLAMSSMSAGAEMSRMGPISREIWRESCEVDVAPGQSFSKDIPTHTKLPANSEITVRMAKVKEPVAEAPAAQQAVKGKQPRSAVEGTIVAMSFSTAVSIPKDAVIPTTRPAK